MGENPGLKLAKIGHLKTLEMTDFPFGGRKSGHVIWLA
jgi:hypothetical protein